MWIERCVCRIGCKYHELQNHWRFNFFLLFSLEFLCRFRCRLSFIYLLRPILRRYACNLMVSNGMYERVLNTIVVHYKSFNSRRRCCRYCRPFRVAATQFRFIILVSPASHTHDQLFVEHKLIFSFRKIKNLLFFQQLPTHTNHQWVRVRVCVSVKYRTQQKSHMNSPRVFTVSFFFLFLSLEMPLLTASPYVCCVCIREYITLVA